MRGRQIMVADTQRTPCASEARDPVRGSICECDELPEQCTAGLPSPLFRFPPKEPVSLPELDLNRHGEPFRVQRHAELPALIEEGGELGQKREGPRLRHE